MEPIIIIGVLAAVIAGSVVWYVTKKTASQADLLDAWVCAQLANALAPRTGSSEADLERSLSGTASSAEVDALREHLSSVFLEFRRSSEHEYSVTLTIKLGDGTVRTVEMGVTRDELPDPVREEFLRTGSASVSRPWAFPEPDPQEQGAP